MKTLRKIAVGLTAFYLALWGLTVFINYPNPIAAIRLGLASPSDTARLLPAAEIPAVRADPWQIAKTPLKEIEVNYQGSKIGLYDFLEVTDTNAFLVIHQDEIVSEIYLNGNDATSELPSYSVAKSVVSILAGQLIAEGKLAESDTFVSFFPEYRTATAYDEITIGQLLDMSSGVAVADNYPDGPAGWGNPIAQMYATTDIPNFILNHRDLYWAPGSNSEYRSVDTQMVSMVLEKITGESLAELVTSRLWTPLGMENPATWNLDHAGGTAKGFCCLNASARDFAKLGKALNDALQSDSFAAISPAWAERMSTSVTTLDYEWGYGAFTWHPTAGANLYLGLHGQYVYTDPNADVVIVKLSNSLSESNNPDVTKVFREIVLAITK